MTQLNANLSIEDRVAIAYKEARARGHDLFRVLDPRFNLLRQRMGIYYREQHSGDAVRAKMAKEQYDKEMKEAEAFFISVRNAPENELAAIVFANAAFTNASPDQRQQSHESISDLVERLMAKGISFEVIRPGNLILFPAAKLTEQDRRVVMPRKKEIMAEIERRRDAWTI
ncbi:hypothetical protein [Acetobacter pasteurianus]